VEQHPTVGDGQQGDFLRPVGGAEVSGRLNTKLNELREARSADEGSALILALVVILIGTMMVLPIMDYTLAVTRANRTASAKADRTEAVKGGLRAALYSPADLYAACLPSGRTTSIALAAPPGLDIHSWCTTTKDSMQDVPTEQRYALITTQAGSNTQIPANYVSPDSSSPELDGTISPQWCTSMSAVPPVPCGFPYPGNGGDPLAWPAQTSTVPTGSKIFSPYLPPFSNTLAYAGGYAMPPDDFGGQCQVYFPGKYTDNVVITGTTPVYFVSGIYYFEKTLRFSGDAHVVVGAGAEAGCVDSDAIAVADAIGAPFDAYSNGVGGTFVFGAEGRLVIDTATASTGTGVNVVFNRRLVDSSDPLAVLNHISISSVTGVWTGTDTVDLDIPGQLHVPETLVYGGTPTDAWTQHYKASTLVSPALPSAPCAPPPTAVVVGCPIIDVNFTTAAKVNVKIPGYISVPQGAVSVSTTPAGKANKTIMFGGGILAAQMTVTTDVPAFMQLGLLNPVVQKTFKVVTETMSGSPHIVATALVQVNETGGYAVNSWVVQLG
jgi:hypothetical protein